MRATLRNREPPSAVERCSLLYHTLRRTRPTQILYRLARKLQPAWVPASNLPDTNGPAPSGWALCARKRRLGANGEFDFGGLRRNVSGAEIWNDDTCPLLWLYNLHYFDDLAADASRDERERYALLIDRWVAENRPFRGVGWHPYTAALRIVNWIKCELTGGTLSDTARRSLALQARWLRHRLELHLLGCHLLADAKALLFAGTRFSGAEATEWFNTGRRILMRELDEQILADGAHFELSTMYQCIVLEDVLDVVQLAGACKVPFLPEEAEKLRAVAARMFAWLSAMTHPDGQIAFFNDGAFDIAPTPAELRQYAAAMGLAVSEASAAPLTVLDRSGYARIQNDYATVICDAAYVGAPYLPGHGHADTLSFELSLRGQRIAVNGGTSTYVDCPERARQRGTAAHNTVVVDDLDSSEVWSSFRVARSARPLAVNSGTLADGTVEFKAAHDGYARTGKGIVHARTWQLRASSLTITDHVEGDWGSAVARLHLHPDARVQHLGDRALIKFESGIEADVRARGLAVEESTWHPRFGVSQRAPVLCHRIERTPTIMTISWPR